MKILGIDTLVSLPVASGATTPVPVGGLPALIWSSTTNSPLVFNGVMWVEVLVPTLQAPSAPTLTYPANGASVSGSTFTVSAYAHSDGVPMFGLQIQRALNSTFTSGVELSPLQNSAALTKTMTATAVGVNVYWRARFIDLFGRVSSWSSTRSYTGVVEFSRVGSVHQVSSALSIAGTQIGDFMLMAACSGDSTPPAGWSYRGAFSTTNAVTSLYSKVATTAGEAVANKGNGYGASLHVFRGITDYVGTPTLTTFGVGVGSSVVALPSGAAGNPNLIVGFDRNPANWVLPSAWTSSYSYDTNLFATVSGYSASAIAGQSATHDLQSYTAGLVSIRLL